DILLALDQGSFFAVYFVENIASDKRIICTKTTLWNRSTKQNATDEYNILVQTQNKLLVEQPCSFDEEDTLQMLTEQQTNGDLTQSIVILIKIGEFNRKKKLICLFQQMTQAYYNFRLHNITQKKINPGSVVMIQSFTKQLGIRSPLKNRRFSFQFRNGEEKPEI
ncbi:MAG: hypothetical protein EZS28_006522, partial [Streblomastix strix]